MSGVFTQSSTYIIDLELFYLLSRLVHIKSFRHILRHMTKVILLFTFTPGHLPYQKCYITYKLV